MYCPTYKATGEKLLVGFFFFFDYNETHIQPVIHYDFQMFNLTNCFRLYADTWDIFKSIFLIAKHFPFLCWMTSYTFSAISLILSY